MKRVHSILRNTNSRESSNGQGTVTDQTRMCSGSCSWGSTISPFSFSGQNEFLKKLDGSYVCFTFVSLDQCSPKQAMTRPGGS